MWAGGESGDPAPLHWIVHDTRALVPTRASHGSAGYDLFTMEATTLPAGCYTKIPTGIGVYKMPRNTFALIKTRSSTPYKTGLRVVDGVIDSDFKNEIQISVFNASSTPTILSQYSSIAQLVLVVQPMLPNTQIIHFKPSILNDQFSQMMAKPGDILINIPFLHQCPFKVGDCNYIPSYESGCLICRTNLSASTTLGWDVNIPCLYHGSRPEQRKKVADLLSPLFTNPTNTGVCFIPIPSKSQPEPSSFNLHPSGVWSRHNNNLGFGSSTF